MANIAILPRSSIPSDNRWIPTSGLHVEHENARFNPLFLNRLNKIWPNGVARGTIAEVCGKRSTGRTSICLSILAEATLRGEVCAVVDLFDSFHAESAASAGVCLEKTVWIRCRGNAEHAIRSADLLLHAGGFGVIVLDLCEASAKMLNRIPLSYWYRFRRVVENASTILVLCVDAVQAKSCSFIQLELQHKKFYWTGVKPFSLLRGLKVNARILKKALSNPEPRVFECGERVAGCTPVCMPLPRAV
jgi:hypothetical protein